MALRVELTRAGRERDEGDAAVVATITNAGPDPAPFHRAHAERASLTLEVVDERGDRVPLPPPSPPDERDLAPPSLMAVGESVSYRYAGFLDRSRLSGRYRVRWLTSHESLGATRGSPLTSDWVEIDIVRLPGPIVRDLTGTPWRYAVTLKRWVIAIIARFTCRLVLERKVDRYVTETITDAVPASWNNTYAWNARFHVVVDQSQQRIVVTIRVKMGVGSPAADWVTKVQGAWSERFKDCATLGCAKNGYPIHVRLQYVTSGAHYLLNVAPGRTSDMLNWGVADNDQAHEVGHMLGNKEEYFTVDGVPFGAARQPGGNIMNNPDNPPVAKHYAIVQATVDAMLGINYSLAGGSTRPASVPCSYV